ncbi:transposase IS891/IS1136/IS1341 family [Crinalium epipsammum PCC 9333]|uniref:Transposase IS891/IS1136/IS1341 family n=1 Tax=Crinalium epipsammum PCC 9333 TaxID=1173022 RepID=K9VZJ7_9CYAN|nr:RNA-guided endonuclease TnpB family protein [Crinalium epipsammum]AFZ12932.1 transposase IS891/IS1136/IS1341 family [Crinalium epipsammum PCC 9333]
MINLTYEYKLIPTQEHTATFEHYLEVCRKVWNYALRERKDWFNSRSCLVNACSIKGEYIIPANAQRPTYHSQANALTKAKKQLKELGTVHSQVLQQTLRTLETAFLSMWERGFGFPRFKKEGTMRSLVFPQMKNGDICGDTIRLPKIGVVKMRMSRPIPDGFDLKQVRVVRRASGWYVMLTLGCDVDVPEPPTTGQPLGIDVGLHNFAATSDGDLIPRSRFLKEKQRQLKLLQRRLKHKKRGSKNWKKLSRKIARLHETIHNCRKDFHFKLAHRLCDGHGMVFVEDLSFKALCRGMFAKHTLDAGFGQFLEILKWVCWKRGIHFEKVDPRGTSQTCSMCYTHTPKKLSDRIHCCENCGYQQDRDIVAAEVIMHRGLVAVGLMVASQVAWEGVLSGASGDTASLGKSRSTRKSHS